MAYRLEIGEKVPEGTRRIAREQIGMATQHLGAGGRRERDTHVHEARKCMKRLRGLVRLVRGQLPPEVYSRENACFRDAARGLAGLRDATVLVESLDDLVDWLGSRAPRSRFAPIRSWLAARHGSAYADEGMASEVVARVLGELGEAGGRVDSWIVAQEGWEGLSRGVRRVYAQGRGEREWASWRPSAETFHSWRKRVKYLWYQTQLLRDVWPIVMTATADELDLLGALLGKDHDLALLSETVRGEFPRSGAASTADALERRIGEQRTKLQEQVQVLGLRAYSESPGAFERRVRGYWQAWQEEQIQDAILVPISSGDVRSTEVSG